MLTVKFRSLVLPIPHLIPDVLIFVIGFTVLLPGCCLKYEEDSFARTISLLSVPFVGDIVEPTPICDASDEEISHRVVILVCIFEML